MPPTRATADEWLWGWDLTPGIVSVHADLDGRATVWRRLPETGALVREEERFRPWLLLRRLDDLDHLRAGIVTWRELSGPGELRYLVSADDYRALTAAVIHGASKRLGRQIMHI